MDNHNTFEELKEVLKNYKKGEYNFGKYGTGDQIERAFLDGKIFVLKGSKKIFLLCIVVLIIAVIMFFFVGVGKEYFILMLISFSIAILIAEFFIIIFCITFIRWFVVIGPSGVYYRNVIKKGFFQWKDVTLAEGSIHTTRGGYRRPSVTTARVTIILPNKAEVLLDSGRYGNKEFVRKVKRLMFLRIFQIYSKLGKDAIET